MSDTNWPKDAVTEPGSNNGFASTMDADSILAPIRKPGQYSNPSLSPSLSTEFWKDPKDSVFRPPLASAKIESKAFKDRSDDNIRQINLDVEFADSEKNKSKRPKLSTNLPSKGSRKLLVVGIVFVLVLIISVAVGVSLSGGGNEENNEIDFCLEFGTTDSAVRQFLADNFDAAVNANEVDYSELGPISCLPSNAFGALSAAQVTTFQQSIALFFRDVNLEKIAEDAFQTEAVNAVVFLDLPDNSLEELPDGIFSPFTSLVQVVLNANNFVTLSNNLFADGNQVVNLFFDTCSLLTEIPQTIQFTPNLAVLGLNNLQFGLEGVNAAVFEDLNSLAVIQVINSPLGNDNGTAFADLIGVDIGVLEL